jgi:sec-independent protein translocase protein TatA
MMGIGFPELMIILVIIMIIFGAGKLPEIGSAFGNSIKNFKKSMKEAEEIQEATNLESTETAEAADGSIDSESSESEAVPNTTATQDGKEN